MSLINDALKKAEKSLNNNSSDQRREQIPSFDFEPSGNNKKLFFILLLGGTLFFSALIALVFLLRSSPEPTLATLPPSILGVSKFSSEISVEEEKPAPIEQAQELSQTESSDAITDESKKAESSDLEELKATDNTEDGEAKKNLNEEFMEGIVGLASRAFTGAPSLNKGLKQEPKDKEPKPDYSLRMAQETLEMLERQTRNQTASNSIEDPVGDFVNNLSITGVMIAGNESQILINNQVYSKNSIINQSLDLKLLDIKSHAITIQDSSGKIYTREF